MVWQTINAFIKFKNVMMALIANMLFLVLFVIAYIFIRHWYPRPSLLSHSTDLNGWMLEQIKYLRQNIALIEDRLKTNALLQDRDSIDKMSAALKAFARVTDDDIIFFFQFYEYHTAVMRGTRLWWYTRNEKHIIPKIAPLSVQLHAKTDNAFKAYAKARLNPIRQLALACNGIVNDHMARFASMYETDPVFDLSVQACNTFLNEYRAQLTFMYDTRKTYGFTLQFNIFRLYLSEQFDTIVNKKIIRDTWGTFWDDVSTTMNDISSWYLGLKDQVMGLPKCMAGFGCDGMDDPNEPKARETVESFVDLIKPLIEIVKFFIEVLKMIPQIFILIINILKLISEPEKMLVAIIGLIIGLIIVIIYTVLASLVSLIALIGAFLYVSTIAIAMTAVWLLIFAVIFVVFVVLWVLDLITGGSVMTWLRCENLPDATIYQPGYIRGNMFSRTLLCTRPCRAKFNPSGLLCNKCNEPVHSPHQYIIQWSKGLISENIKPLPDDYIHAYKSGIFTATKSDKKKRREILDYYKNKKQFLAASFKQTPDDEKHTARSVCANLDTLIANSANSKQMMKDLDKMKGLCAQIHCQFKESNDRFGVAVRSSGERDLFCDKLAIVPDEQEMDRAEGMDIVTRTIYAFAVATCATIFVIVCLQPTDLKLLTIQS